MKKTFSYIPAQPDFYTAEFVEGKGPNYHLNPIIGWEIGSDMRPDGSVECTFVYPVTVEGTDTTAPIVYPDGRVCIPHDAFYDSIDDWVKEKMEQQKKSLGSKGAEEITSH